MEEDREEEQYLYKYFQVYPHQCSHLLAPFVRNRLRLYCLFNSCLFYSKYLYFLRQGLSAVAAGPRSALIKASDQALFIKIDRVIKQSNSMSEPAQSCMVRHRYQSILHSLLHRRPQMVALAGHLHLAAMLDIMSEVW